MTGTGKALFVGAIAVLALDTIGSLLSKRYGFSYQLLGLVTGLIYIGAARASYRSGGWTSAILCGAVLGLLDGTVGWAISWAIGPGRIALTPGREVAAVVITSIIVVLFAACIGAFGGAIEWFGAKRRAAYSQR